MTRHFSLLETHIVLRTILNAGALAVLLVLACAGAAVGATTWVVDDDGGAGVDYTTIWAAVDAAGDGDTTFVRSGTNDENVENRKRAHVHEDQEGRECTWKEGLERQR